MRSAARITAAVPLAALLLSCAGVPQERVHRRETLTQVSVLDALVAGDYDAKMDCARLLEFGDFGIGTFDAPDG